MCFNSFQFWCFKGDAFIEIIVVHSLKEVECLCHYSTNKFIAFKLSVLFTICTIKVFWPIKTCVCRRRSNVQTAIFLPHILYSTFLCKQTRQKKRFQRKHVEYVYVLQTDRQSKRERSRCRKEERGWLVQECHLKEAEVLQGIWWSEVFSHNLMINTTQA